MPPSPNSNPKYGENIGKSEKTSLTQEEIKNEQNEYVNKLIEDKVKLILLYYNDYLKGKNENDETYYLIYHYNQFKNLGLSTEEIFSKTGISEEIFLEIEEKEKEKENY